LTGGGEGRRPVGLWNRLRLGRPLRHAAHYEQVLGTSLELQLLAADGEVAATAEQAALAEIDRLEEVFSGYASDSEFLRWESTQGVDVAVSPELGVVLRDAEEWRMRTGGAFNPAAEALYRLWSEQSGCGEAAAPGAEALQPVLARMHTPLWSVNWERKTARRLTSLPVSLNAIAKGFIVDRACEAAANVPGIQGVLLNLGGDIRHVGPAPLSVAIADPASGAENAPAAAVVKLQGGALATSGGYRRGFRLGERWVSHLFDPRSGQPVDHVASASVIAPDAATADVLATAFSVLQPEESVRVADSMPGVACLLIGRDGAQSTNGGWRRLSLPSH
jgi:thiamine biosynthesis lipoprotein